MKRVSKVCLMSLSLWLAVGPMALLQLGAWAWMLTSYSQESNIEQAFKETFSGERPCEMCRVIESVQEADESSDSDPFTSETKSLKLMLGLERAIIVPEPRSVRVDRLSAQTCYVSAEQGVPTPPPRSRC